MRTSLFTTYDRVAMQSEGIFHARNKADAMRHFANRFKDRDDAADFSLLYLGEMDHDSSEIQLNIPPEEIPITLHIPKTNKTNKESE